MKNLFPKMRQKHSMQLNKNEKKENIGKED